MRNITEASMLLRVRVDLPVGFKLAMDEFQEGWQFVRTLDAGRLTKKFRTRGWNFISIGEGVLKSGVGDTSQEAIARALKLALNHFGASSDAVEVKHIQMTQYPWFFLAKVIVNPYELQVAVNQKVPVRSLSLPAAPRVRRLPANAAALYPDFGVTMPMLKQMLISARGSEAGTL